MSTELEQRHQDISAFQSGHYYKTKDSKTLMYVMGFLYDELNRKHIICRLFMWSLNSLKHVDSIQGTDVIMLDQWLEINKNEYDSLKSEIVKSEMVNYDQD